MYNRYFAVVQRKTIEETGKGHWSLYYFRELKDGETIHVPDEPEETPWDKYKIYRDDGYEGFDISLEECMNKTPSTTYNPQLAHMLMALSNAAYNDNHISQSLSSLGFNNRYRNSALFITYSIGTKQLDDGTTLVLVAVRGSDGILDWMSNFDLRVNASGYHTGFADAADEIYKSLTARLGGENFSNVKFVITGHSRGAAAANLLEVKLGQKGVSQKNVYGYNFACPDVAVGYGSDWNPSGKYDNIFNINNAADPVSVVPGVLGSTFGIGTQNPFKPFTSWGKFGQSRWYARVWNNLDYTTLNPSKHDPKLYLEDLRGESSFGSFKTWEERMQAITSAQAETIGKLFGICCPVDVVITDDNSMPVASVIGGKVNYYNSTFGKVMIFTSGDEKAIFIQGDEPLNVQLTATDEGTMDYTVQTVNLDIGEALYETAFLDVELTDGKQMQSSVDDGVDVQKVSLYVLDDSGSRTEEIKPDHEGPVENRENPFTDVNAGDYYYDAVLWAVANDITSGTSATKFSPNDSCTRAQIVTFLWRAAGSPSVNASNPFKDVSRGDYYYDAVLWAVQNGITSGTSATTFGPGQKCTRAEAVTFLYRAKNSPAASGTNRFTDVSSGAYYANAVQWAVNTGVTAGTSSTKFSPDQTCTRAQIVTFLHRDRTN